MGPDPAVAACRLAVRPLFDEEGETVLVACSGGADSLALLAATVFEAARSREPSDRGRVVGVTVDHGLQAGSAAHAAHVVAQMAALGATETVSVRVHVESAGQGPEAAARQARYAVLDQVAERFGADAVLLGHTRDDQAETVLLGLTRGSGGRALAGMRRGFDRYRRPFLDLTRADTEAACRAQGIDFWTDPHNADPRFLRARVRHTVMPLLEQELGPGVASTLARTADQLRNDSEALDALAQGRYEELTANGPVQWRRLHDDYLAIASRVLRLAALDAGAPAAELFAVHVDALVALVEGRGREVQLPGRVTAYRDGDHLRFRPTGAIA
ncbi:MAG: tRNA lysidine(34) synthetase TilS [Nocardioidaceae bacterium]